MRERLWWPAAHPTATNDAIKCVEDPCCEDLPASATPVSEEITVITNLKSQLQDAPSGPFEMAGNASAGWHKDAVLSETCGAFGQAVGEVSSFASAGLGDCVHSAGTTPLHSDCWAIVMLSQRQAGQKLRTNVRPASLEVMSESWKTETCLMEPAHLQAVDDENDDAVDAGFIFGIPI